MKVGYRIALSTKLSASWLDVFPQSLIWYDFFHFQQAIVKNTKKMGLTELAAEIAGDTRELWNANSKELFDELVENFLVKWKPRIPQFTSYFENTWKKRSSLPSFVLLLICGGNVSRTLRRDKSNTRRPKKNKALQGSL